MEEFYTNRDGRKLFVRREGEGETVLLIHGAMVDADFYQDLSKILSQRYQVITYDRRAYSRSEDCEDASLTSQVEDAAELLKAYGSGRAVVVGCSAGALIALKLAERYPELVRRTYIDEAPLIFFSDALNEEEKQWLSEMSELVDAGKVRKALMKFIIVFASMPDPHARILPPEMVDQQMKNGNVYIAREYPEQFRLREDFYDWEQLAQRDIVWLIGDTSKDLYAAKTTKAAATRLGQSVFCIGGGHNAARDLPEEFACFLCGHLQLH